jgi:uncharacterized protein (TIGR01777 family)
MKRILMTGATGFIGSHLVRALSARGDDVRVLSRRPRAGSRDIQYTPTERGDWYREVSGTDVVIHLAGEPVIGGRWTAAMRKKILSSRVEGTRRLVEAMAEAKPRPSVFVCASAVGYYGPRTGDDPADESAPPGSDFLAEVCVEWERAALEAESLGIRVVRARIGIVFGADGGALAAMLTPFKMFVGGPIGDGSQMVAWIHIDDTVRSVLFAIDDMKTSGAMNVVAPRAVSNAELSRAIGRALRRPSWLRVPAFVLKAGLGEASSAILTGQAARPRVLSEAGFTWQHPDLDEALADLMSRGDA